jgi:transcriptional regulator with XRE-family HTH domain
MFDSRKFGAYLSRLRINEDMTQSEIADKLNLTRQAISKYETGDSFPDISTILAMSKIFNVTTDELIQSGDPTTGETDIFHKVTNNDSASCNNVSDVLNLAPLLKPSALEKLSEGLSKQGINISHVVALAEYMNNESVLKMLENANYDAINDELLEKFIPLLDDKSKNIIFQKILEGELDYHLIKIILPYAEYLMPYIDAAVVEGALDTEVLHILSEYHNVK